MLLGVTLLLTVQGQFLVLLAAVCISRARPHHSGDRFTVLGPVCPPGSGCGARSWRAPCFSRRLVPGRWPAPGTAPPTRRSRARPPCCCGGWPTRSSSLRCSLRLRRGRNRRRGQRCATARQLEACRDLRGRACGARRAAWRVRPGLDRCRDHRSHHRRRRARRLRPPVVMFLEQRPLPRPLAMPCRCDRKLEAATRPKSPVAARSANVADRPGRSGAVHRISSTAPGAGDEMSAWQRALPSRRMRGWPPTCAVKVPGHRRRSRYLACR